MTPYLCSILDKFGIDQTSTITIPKDNTVAIIMANASCPIRQNRQMEIKYAALLQWVEINQLIILVISTHDSPIDGITKSLGPQFLVRHAATLLGKRNCCIALFELSYSLYDMQLVSYASNCHMLIVDSNCVLHCLCNKMIHSTWLGVW